MITKIVRHRGTKWRSLVLKGWMTIKVFKCGVAIVAAPIDRG